MKIVQTQLAHFKYRVLSAFKLQALFFINLIADAYVQQFSNECKHFVQNMKHLLDQILGDAFDVQVFKSHTSLCSELFSKSLRGVALPRPKNDRSLAELQKSMHFLSEENKELFSKLQSICLVFVDSIVLSRTLSDQQLYAYLTLVLSDIEDHLFQLAMSQNIPFNDLRGFVSFTRLASLAKAVFKHVIVMQFLYVDPIHRDFPLEVSRAYKAERKFSKAKFSFSRKGNGSVSAIFNNS